MLNHSDDTNLFNYPVHKLYHDIGEALMQHKPLQAAALLEQNITALFGEPYEDNPHIPYHRLFLWIIENRENPIPVSEKVLVTFLDVHKALYLAHYGHTTESSNWLSLCIMPRFSFDALCHKLPKVSQWAFTSSEWGDKSHNNWVREELLRECCRKGFGDYACWLSNQGVQFVSGFGGRFISLLTRRGEYHAAKVLGNNYGNPAESQQSKPFGRRGRKQGPLSEEEKVRRASTRARNKALKATAAQA